jgi:PPM family protein phosphatase
MSIWERLFRKKEHIVDDPAGPAQSPLPDFNSTRSEAEAPLENPIAGEQAPPPGFELEISLQTDAGVVRTNNEDRGFYTRPGDPAVCAKKGTLVLVADGMGGALAGEVASELAARIVPEAYYASAEDPGPALKKALENASREIHQTAQKDPQLRGMGTTCVALAVRGREAFMAYVGDSRLYLFRDGKLYQLTEDHSVVFELVRQGVLTREQARNHEERNVLSLSMGGRPEIEASGWQEPFAVRAGDRFLLCSDGLHDLVNEDEIQKILAEQPPAQAVRELIEAAKSNGGHDNITAAVVYASAPIPGKPETDPRATREFTVEA